MEQETTTAVPPYTSFEDLVAKYDYFLFDCDGVLWHGDSEIERAFSALRHIQSHEGKHVFLITNNSTRQRESVIEEKLKPMGGDDFVVPLENIYTSSYVTGQYIKQNYAD